MPRTAGSSPFTGQSLKGMELDVKLEDQGTPNWACLFAATAFDVQVAAATTSRQHTLNKGSRTSTGAAGEITATCDVFVVPDSPGQWMVNRAFETGAKIDIRRTLFADKVGDDVTLAATTSYQVSAATGIATGAAVPRSGGLFDWTDTAANTPLKTLLALAEPGMTIQVGTDNYFIGYRAQDDSDGPVLYISPSPDDNETTGTASLITGTNNSYPYFGAAYPATRATSGTLKLYRGRVQQTLYKGTVTVPIVATDAAPGDDGNDLSTAQVSFALDSIGTPSYLAYT